MVEIQVAFLAHGINYIISSIVLQALRFKAFEGTFLENMEPFQWTKCWPLFFTNSTASF